MLRRFLQRSVPSACLVLSLLSSCASEGKDAPTTSAFDLSSCDTSFEARASRVGSQGQARLSYACAAEICGASAPFAAGTSLSVIIEVPSDVAGSLEVESSDPSVISATSTRAVVDPCLGQTRAFLTLDALAPGRAKLRVHADGIEDELSVEVLAAGSVSLRASPIRQFDFSPRAALEALALAGEPLLVVPALLSTKGEPLLGLPTLTWSVSDENLASVRTKPNSEDESFVRDWADESAVFLDAKKAGMTRINARTESGTQGTLSVSIINR